MSRGFPLVGLLTAAFLMNGCAYITQRGDQRRLESLLVEAEGEGVHLDHILALKPEVKARVRQTVGEEGTEMERIQKLHRWLRGELGFRYDPHKTVVAQEAWDTKSGDCLSYAHLFNALARFLKLPVNYVRYREAATYEEANGHLVVVSHVASLYNDYRVTILVELTGAAPSWRVSDYEYLGDDEAAALHFSNLAMEHLQKGDLAWAERVLKMLDKETPNLPEIKVNLAAVLMEEQHYDQALEVLERGIKQSPDFAPLYVDASLAARGAGKDELANEFAEKARSSRVDPFMPFVKGTWLVEKGQYQAAEKLFARAVDLSPSSALFTAWLARAQLLEGRSQLAEQTFAKASALNPRHPVLDDFRKRHVEFRGCAGCGEYHSQL